MCASSDIDQPKRSLASFLSLVSLAEKSVRALKFDLVSNIFARFSSVDFGVAFSAYKRLHVKGSFKYLV